MKARLLVASLLLIPTTVAAQPAETPPPPSTPVAEPPPPPPPPPPQDTMNAPMPVQTPAPVYQVAPEPTGPRRAGFTIETSLGIGSTMISSNGESESFASLAGLDLGIGGFVTPNLALTARIAGTTFSPEGSDEQLTAAFFGPSLQYWVNDRLFVGGGAGLAVFASDEEDEPESGIGLDGRIGYGVFVGRSATVFVTGEITPGIFDDGNVIGLGAKVGVQLF